MKTLGIDLGTNSIGWAIIDETCNCDQIIDCGVTLFPEGVKIEKGNESSKATDRTGFRLARRQKFRCKLRKIRTLSVLADNGMCPLSQEEINNWLKNNRYPSNPEFIKWYKTDETHHWEPYYLRKKCAEQSVSPLELGRALYHIAQRRGFLSNRKESAEESDGAVKSNINRITAEKGDLTLGQYFYNLKQHGERVRANYTSRNEHYLEEFNKICEVQKIDDELKNRLHNAIFYQRPLKSQKYLVGKCTFEPNKPRCPISHFEYEEYRMLSFINNIKVKRKTFDNDNIDFEPLNKEEIEIVKSKFFRKIKTDFAFEDIVKALKKSKDRQYWEFNYPDFTSVAPCPVSAELMSIFGKNWKETKIDNYDIYDIWHVLFDFDDDDKLFEFAKNKLHLDDENAKKFKNIRLPQGYASLSLKAIRKILVFLRERYIYSYAVFLANIPAIIGRDEFDKNKNQIIDTVEKIIDNRKYANNIITLSNECLRQVIAGKDGSSYFEQWDKRIIEKQAVSLFGQKNWANKSELTRQNILNEVAKNVDEQLSSAKTRKFKDIRLSSYRIDDQIDQYIAMTFVRKTKAELYHPSENEKFKPAIYKDGYKLLNTPIVDSVKNPVVMRAMHQLKKLINYLIMHDEIDSYTRIHIELANNVNDKNMRTAISLLQKENETFNQECRKELEKNGISDPTDSDVKKYRLWKEQNKMCFYTGNKISFGDLFGDNPTYDFEHTIPRSLCWDNSLANLTLCESKFNRSDKQQKIPSQLPNYDEILQRVESCYKDKIKVLKSEIERNRTRGGYSSKDEKDKKIANRNKAKLKLDYYTDKMRRFKMTDVDSGFKHSQINDTRTITKFALAYLKTVFEYVMPVKGGWTAEFRKQWGLQEYDEPKNRSIQTHHAADAIVVACVDRGKYNMLNEIARQNKSVKIRIAPPWETFASDVRHRLEYVFPKYQHKNVAIKNTKKLLKNKRTGKPILNNNGEKIYLQGDTARGALHLETFYGQIRDPADGQIKCVVRKPIADVKPEQIVDARLRQIYTDNIKNGIDKNGLLMPFKNQGRDVYVKKVRIYAKTTNPIALKHHRDVSKFDYKRAYYVVNDSNYMLVIYRGTDKNGKELSDFRMLNLLDAVKRKKSGDAMYSETVDKKGAVLSRYKNLMIGKAVILLDNDNEDAKSFDKKTLWERYYIVRGLGVSAERAYISLMHNISSDVYVYEANKSLQEYAKCRRFAFNQIKCLVEDQDFIITPTGEFKFN